MAEEKKDNWTTWIALSTAAMAVLAALTTLYMGKFSSRAVLSQAQASDQWAYYQAKSIKSHTYEMQKDKMEIDRITFKDRMSAEASEKYKKTLTSYDEEIKRYDKEKKEIKEKAESLERERQVSQERGGKFAFALIFLQIAIMCSSISAITKKPPLWYMGIAMTAIGVFFFIDGFYLLY